MTDKEFEKFAKEVRTLCNFVALQISDIAEKYKEHPVKVNKLFTKMHVTISEEVERQIKEMEEEDEDID